MRPLTAILFLLYMIALQPARATEPFCFDTTAVAPAVDVPLAADSASVAKPKKSLFSRFLAYFNDANKEKKNKRFDFSVIGGPHYSSDTKLGIGLVAAGLYRSDPTDSLSAPSNVSLFGDVSTVGFYMLGVRGTHIFPDDRQRIDHTVYFYSFPCKFWGMGYDMGNDDANRSDMKRWQAQMKVSWLLRTANDLFVGPTVAVDYVIAREIQRPELFNGQPRRTLNFGVGATLLYDTRDNLTAPKHGVYLSLQQMFRPTWLGNTFAFSTTDLRTSGYIPVWKGCTFAADFRTTLNFGNPSWGMMALLGNSYSMRGYYEGRYRDKHKMEAQIELRQHIWKRNGMVLWAGAGTVFPRFSAIEMKHILPCYGIGYRWEFKKNVNVRLDYGMGKGGQSGFIFNINEAF